MESSMNWYEEQMNEQKKRLEKDMMHIGLMNTSIRLSDMIEMATLESLYAVGIDPHRDEELEKIPKGSVKRVRITFNQ